METKKMFTTLFPMQKIKLLKNIKFINLLQTNQKKENTYY